MKENFRGLVHNVSSDIWISLPYQGRENDEPIDK